MPKTDRLLDLAAWILAIGALILVSLFPSNLALPWVKAAPAVLWGLSFLVVRNPGWNLMAPALGFAALGDFFLAVGGDWFFVGAGAFAVMQGLYAWRFWGLALGRRPRQTGRALTAILAFGTATAVVLVLGWTRLGPLAGPMAAYAVLLTAMASGSVSAGRGWVLGLGGALFFLSDGMILGFRAWPVSLPTELFILIPYYWGQYLIVRAIRKKV